MSDTKRKKASLNIVDGPEFPATSKAAWMTTPELSKHLNAVFRRTFADYVGCAIEIDLTNYPPEALMLSLDARHPIQVNLYFRPYQNIGDTEGKMLAFKPISGPSSDNDNSKITNIINGHQQIMTWNRSSLLTQDAIDIVHPLLWGELYSKTSKDPSAKELANKGIFYEVTLTEGRDPVNNQFLAPQKSVYNVIGMLDINRIISKLWGGTDRNKSYFVTPTKPALDPQTYQRWVASEQSRVRPIAFGANGTLINSYKTQMPYLVSINELDEDAVNEVYSTIAQPGSSQIMTEAY